MGVANNPWKGDYSLFFGTSFGKDEIRADARFCLARLLNPEDANGELHLRFFLPEDSNRNGYVCAESNGKRYFLTALEAWVLAYCINYESANIDKPLSAKDAAKKEFVFNNRPADGRSGYVYVLHGVGTDFYKIGRTNNLDRRIKEISPVLPFDLDLVWSIKTNDCFELESFFHSIFADLRTNGEWFKLRDENIAEIIGFGEEFNLVDIAEYKGEFYDLLEDPWIVPAMTQSHALEMLRRRRLEAEHLEEEVQPETKAGLILINGGKDEILPA